VAAFAAAPADADAEVAQRIRDTLAQLHAAAARRLHAGSRNCETEEVRAASAGLEALAHSLNHSVTTDSWLSLKVELSFWHELGQSVVRLLSHAGPRARAR